MTSKPQSLHGELRRHKTRFWGRNYVITPRLVEWIHGDGLQVIYFMPLNTRPDYYVARIDSRISLDNSDAHSFAFEVLEALCEHIEEQFGASYEEWESDKNSRKYARHNPFPALSDDSGCCWGLLKMEQQ